MKRRVPLKRTPMKRRRSKHLRLHLWPELSTLIRARDGKCLMDGFDFGLCGGALQGSHVYPRGTYPLLMLHPHNVLTLCYRHHLFVWHKDPLAAASWFQTTYPAWDAELRVLVRTSLARKGMSEAEIRAEWARHGLGTRSPARCVASRGGDARPASGDAGREGSAAGDPQTKDERRPVVRLATRPV